MKTKLMVVVVTMLFALAMVAQTVTQLAPAAPAAGDKASAPCCSDKCPMGKDGKMEKYWFEMSNLSNMVSRGIKKTTFKAGDKVTVTYHPLKDGRKGGNYTSIVAADGHHYE